MDILQSKTKKTLQAVSEGLCKELTDQTKKLAELGVGKLGEHCLAQCRAPGDFFPSSQSSVYPAGSCSPLGNGLACSLSLIQEERLMFQNAAEALTQTISN